MKGRYKTAILGNICYTPLVYDRICKKLNIQSSTKEIEELIYTTIQKTENQFFKKIGKNYYISNRENNMIITINSSTYRVITVDKISKVKGLLFKDNHAERYHSKL